MKRFNNLIYINVAHLAFQWQWRQ